MLLLADEFPIVALVRDPDQDRLSDEFIGDQGSRVGLHRGRVLLRKSSLRDHAESRVAEAVLGAVWMAEPPRQGNPDCL